MIACIVTLRELHWYLVYIGIGRQASGIKMQKKDYSKLAISLSSSSMVVKSYKFQCDMCPGIYR
jgi:hypothetical protein